VPVLRECVRDSNPYSRVYASQALWDLARDQQTTVPVLKGIIADTNLIEFHQWSIGLLSEMGTGARDAVPLLESRTNWNGMFSEQIQKSARDAIARITLPSATNALKAIGSEAAAKAGVK